MADKKSKDKEEEPTVRFLIPRSWMPYWRLGTLIAFLVCCWYWFHGPKWWAKQFPPEPKTVAADSGSGVSTPLPAESPKPTSPCPPAKERKEIRVQVDPVEWSEWIEIPANCWWEVNRPGCWEEYLYIDGTLEKADDGETKGPGSIPRSTFKIRGTKGEVVIYYEPK